MCLPESPPSIPGLIFQIPTDNYLSEQKLSNALRKFLGSQMENWCLDRSGYLFKSGVLQTAPEFDKLPAWTNKKHQPSTRRSLLSAASCCLYNSCPSCASCPKLSEAASCSTVIHQLPSAERLSAVKLVYCGHLAMPQLIPTQTQQILYFHKIFKTNLPIVFISDNMLSLYCEKFEFKIPTSTHPESTFNNLTITA